MLAIDAAATGHTDLVAWSPDAVRLYRNGTQLLTNTGLERIRGAISIAAGDFDNDGFMDLCVLTESEAPISIATTKGHFEPAFDAALPQAPRFPLLPSGSTTITTTISTCSCSAISPHSCAIKATPDSRTAPPIFRS